MEGFIPMIIRGASQDDAPSIARVHIDTWRTTYRGILIPILKNVQYMVVGVFSQDVPRRAVIDPN